MKKKITLENIACIFIILCPVLDMASFIFRNAFDTSFSPSTFIRPIIPIVLGIIMFFKTNRKLKLVLLAIIYAVYGAVHLYLFQTLKTSLSYSSVTHELQYIVNYTFMILNLILYLWISKDDTDKLKKSLAISCAIYIISIYISILTGTSSSTYIEGMGYKGWFESGNSISAILTLSLFIIIMFVKEKKYIIPVIALLVAVRDFLDDYYWNKSRFIWFYISFSSICSL